MFFTICAIMLDVIYLLFDSLSLLLFYIEASWYKRKAKMVPL
jgi:hypothetical protein